MIEEEIEQIVEKPVKIEKEIKVPVQRNVEKPVYRDVIIEREIPNMIE